MAVEIPLSRGMVATIDAADLPLVAGRVWYANRGRTAWYALDARSKAKMHRVILGCESGIDHRDGNGLNNCRSNLRSASNSQNQANRGKPRGEYTSNFKGVTFHKLSRKWMAQLWYQGRRLYLGLFADEPAAARAYDASALIHFGEYARINFPAGAAP